MYKLKPSTDQRHLSGTRSNYILCDCVTYTATIYYTPSRIIFELHLPIGSGFKITSFTLSCFAALTKKLTWSILWKINDPDNAAWNEYMSDHENTIDFQLLCVRNVDWSLNLVETGKPRYANSSRKTITTKINYIRLDKWSCFYESEFFTFGYLKSKFCYFISSTASTPPCRRTHTKLKLIKRSAYQSLVHLILK